MADVPEIDQEVLDEIRRAAFELRRTDPQEAVRTLRRIAELGGPAEVLARGALGEIYFDELGDLDAAESEFRKVLGAAPHLPAAELGLARVLRESGRFEQAEASYLQALQGFGREAAVLVSAGERGEELPEGAEETVLALLEVAVELGDLRHERGRNGKVGVPVDEGVLAFALKAHLFDPPQDEEGAVQGDLGDWTRFHSLWADLRLLTGRAGEAVGALAQAEAAGQLEPADAAILLSRALEDAGDAPAALREGKRRLALLVAGDAPLEPDEVSHAAGLAQELGDEAGAKALIQGALDHTLRLAAAARPGEREDLDETARTLREWLGPGGLVGLGRKR